MELQHDVGRECHVLVRLVDELKGVAVAGDLLLGAVAGRGHLQDNGLDPSRCGDDALDAVRGLARFDDRRPAENLELFRDLGDEEILPAARLTEPLDRRELGGVEDETGELLRGQRAHEPGNGDDKWGNKSTWLTICRGPIFVMAGLQAMSPSVKSSISSTSYGATRSLCARPGSTGRLPRPRCTATRSSRSPRRSRRSPRARSRRESGTGSTRPPSSRTSGTRPDA